MTGTRLRTLMVFDGECVLCGRWVVFVLRRSDPSDLGVTSRNSATWKDDPKSVLVGEATDHSVVAISGDSIFYESDAVIAILKTLRRPWRWLSVIGIIPSFLRNPIYRSLAAIRYRVLGKVTECATIPTDLRDRVL